MKNAPYISSVYSYWVITEFSDKTYNKKKELRNTQLYICYRMVTPRGPSAKHFWDGIEQFGEQLEELGVGDEETENV
jgi:hypothetical protein